MKKLLIIGAAAVALTASADTVAWWHFDECAPGSAFRSSTAIIDSCGNAPNGSPLVTGGTGTSQFGNQPEVRPRPVFPFVGQQVYDPVGVTTNANRSALRTLWADKDNIKAFYGGVVRIPGTNPSSPDSTQPTDAITVECFVCTTNSNDAVPNTFMPIFGKKRGSSWTAETWALYVRTNGKLALRIATEAQSSSYILGYSANPYGVYAVNDGNWHHVAFTYDKVTGVAKVYVDYKLDQTHQLTAGKALVYDTNSTTPNYHAIWIGGYPYSDSSNGRILNGCVDELRISNTVLEPQQFLRLVPTAALQDDEDTVLHLTFDCDTARALQDGEVFNGMVGGLQARYYAVSGADDSTYDTTEKAGNTVAAGLYSSSAMADTASFYQTTNTTGKANYVRVANTSNALFPDGAPDITNLNYTIEAFFKTKGKGQVRQNVLKFGTDFRPAQFVIGDAGHSHQIQFGYHKGAEHSWANDSPYSPVDKPCDDGNWHHVAFVSDASNNLVRAYYDYELVATQTGVYVPVRKGYSLFVGSSENGGSQFFDGWVDDIRLTKRVLDPTEFLTTHPVGSGTQPLLTAMLEQDYDFVCAADDYWTVTGVGAARTNGTVPVFEKASRGTLLLDGTNGTVEAENKWSARMDRSNIIFPANQFYELDAYTVEFWARFDGYKEGDAEKPANYKFDNNNHVGILRFVQGDTTTFDWYLYRLAYNPNGFQVAIRQANNTIAYKLFLLDRLVADGKWHHYALQFSRNADNTEGSVLLYADYKPLAHKSDAAPDPQTFAGFYEGATSHRLMFMESTSDNYNILGNIDAVRFWCGNPAPSQFFGRVRKGFMLIVQ